MRQARHLPRQLTLASRRRARCARRSTELPASLRRELGAFEEEPNGAHMGRSGVEERTWAGGGCASAREPASWKHGTPARRGPEHLRQPIVPKNPAGRARSRASATRFTWIPAPTSSPLPAAKGVIREPSSRSSAGATPRPPRMLTASTEWMLVRARCSRCRAWGHGHGDQLTSADVGRLQARLVERPHEADAQLH